MAWQLFNLLLSVGLTSLSFAPFNEYFGFCAWFCFVPILVLLYKQGFRQSFKISFVFFFVLFLTLFWINPFADAQRFGVFWMILGLFIFFFGLPLAYSLVFSFLSFVSKKAFPLFYPFIFAGGWIVFEWALAVMPVGFPLSMAISQAHYPMVIQIAGLWGGIYLVSFALIFTNTALAAGFICFKAGDLRRMKIFLALAVFMILAILGYGFLRLSAPRSLSYIKIGLVQPNFSLSRADKMAFSDLCMQGGLDLLEELSLELVSKEADILIWPELAVNRYALQDEKFNKVLSAFVKGAKTPLLFGTLWYDNDQKKPANAAAIISSTGASSGLYLKNYLMPFSESSDYAAGSGLGVIDCGDKIGKIGVFICFESLFPQIAKKLANNGANILILLSNDAWFGKTRWAYLHADNIFFRAVETGLPAIHLNNSGPSYVVDGFGRKIASLLAFQTTQAVISLPVKR